MAREILERLGVDATVRLSPRLALGRIRTISTLHPEDTGVDPQYPD
jgi:hypothetical protein